MWFLFVLLRQKQTRSLPLHETGEAPAPDSEHGWRASLTEEEKWGES